MKSDYLSFFCISNVLFFLSHMIHSLQLALLNKFCKLLVLQLDRVVFRPYPLAASSGGKKEQLLGYDPRGRRKRKVCPSRLAVGSWCHVSSLARK